MVFSVPWTRGRATTDSRTRPRETHPGILSQRSDHILPGELASAAGASLLTRGQHPCSGLRYPSFHPVLGPISSALIMTWRAGAPETTARRSFSAALSASMFLIVAISLAHGIFAYTISLMALRSLEKSAWVDAASTPGSARPTSFATSLRGRLLSGSGIVNSGPRITYGPCQPTSKAA